MAEAVSKSSHVGRPVRLASISLHGQALREVAKLVEQTAEGGTDLVVLPETWNDGWGPEPLDGETVSRMAALAKRYQTYIVCPIDRSAEQVRLNTAVLLDRNGEIAGLYDKVYPYWSEFERNPR